MRRSFVVAEHRQVAYDNTVHRGGESFTIDVVGDLEGQAKVWLTNGWVTEIDAPEPAPKKRRKRRPLTIEQLEADRELHG